MCYTNRNRVGTQLLRCEYTNIVYVLYQKKKLQGLKKRCEYTNIVYVLYQQVNIMNTWTGCEYTNIVYVLYQNKYQTNQD